MGVQTGIVPVGVSGDVPQNSEHQLPQVWAIPLWGIYPKDSASFHRDTGSSKFFLVLFIISRNCKESTCLFTEQWIRKMYSDKMKYLSGIEKNEIIKFDDNSVEWEKCHSVLGNLNPD